MFSPPLKSRALKSSAGAVENEKVFRCLLLIRRVAAPAGRRDFGLGYNVKDKGTINPSSLDLT